MLNCVIYLNPTPINSHYRSSPHLLNPTHPYSTHQWLLEPHWWIHYHQLLTNPPSTHTQTYLPHKDTISDPQLQRSSQAINQMRVTTKINRVRSTKPSTMWTNSLTTTALLAMHSIPFIQPNCTTLNYKIFFSLFTSLRILAKHTTSSISFTELLPTLMSTTSSTIQLKLHNLLLQTSCSLFTSLRTLANHILLSQFLSPNWCPPSWAQLVPLYNLSWQPFTTNFLLPLPFLKHTSYSHTTTTIPFT